MGTSWYLVLNTYFFLSFFRLTNILYFLFSFLFFVERESFNLWHPFLMIALYYQTKTPISFWCRQWLNSRSLIQPLEILPVELTEPTNIFYFSKTKNVKSCTKWVLNIQYAELSLTRIHICMFLSFSLIFYLFLI